MRYNQIREMDISNGPGIRVSIFTQGCNLHCKNCFNKDAWDYGLGNQFDKSVQDKILELCDRHYINGLSILGGEPLSEQNLDDITSLCSAFKERFPEKTIWLWTGHVYEELSDAQKKSLANVDVLIDGPFIEELHDFGLKYRGSSNQRILRRQDNDFNYSI